VGEKIVVKKDFFSEIKENPALQLKGKIGIEAAFMTVDMLNNLKGLMPQAEFVCTENVVEEIASVKDENELALLRHAIKITDDVFAEVIKMLKPGVQERDLAAEITYRHMKHGAEKDSFDTIVASGYRGALPHGEASDKKIERGDFVVFDMGCVYKGYCSDMTRTVIVGEPTKKHREIYDIVLKAQLAAIDACHANMSGTALDKVARDIIKDAGYGENYGHGLGHGLGLEIHTHPRATYVVDHWLMANQVITIEPGIYLSGWGGVRIEDAVVIKEKGCEILTGTTKELIVVE
jgi:Xaa-Pro aminopeptidase